MRGGAAARDVRIRPVEPARASDLRAVAVVAHATWPSAYRDILPPETVAVHLRTAYTPAALATRLRLDGSLFLLAEAAGGGRRHGGRPVAFCQAGRRLAASGEADLWAIYVRPSCQGCGIGRRLVEAAAAAMPDCRLHVALAAANEGAAAFYGALGFAAEGDGYVATIQGVPLAMRSMVRARASG
jgi:diamine N-acetyltransferase